MKRIKGRYLIASLALSGVVVLLFALIGMSNSDIRNLTENELIAVVGGCGTSGGPYSCVPYGPGQDCTILPDRDDDMYCHSKEATDENGVVRCIALHLGCGQDRTTAPNPDTRCSTDGNPTPRCVEYERGCHKVSHRECETYYWYPGGCTCELTGEPSQWWGTSRYVTGTLCWT